MTNGLSHLTLQINDQIIAYLPNTLSLKKGKGDVNVRAQSAGSGATSAVVTEDVETQKGMVKFSLSVTDVNRNYLDIWQDNRNNGGNTIRLSAKNSSIPISYIEMNVINDPEVNASSDGVIEIEFEGPPAG